MEGEVLARVGIGEVRADCHGNIVKPYRNCYVITTAGQIWDVKVDAFGANEDNLRALWKTSRSYVYEKEFMSNEPSPEAKQAAKKRYHIATSTRDLQRTVYAVGYDAATAKLRETKRDGSWIDKMGACKVCDGEIPHGHTANCDIWKLEQEIDGLKQANSGLYIESNQLRKELGIMSKGFSAAGDVIIEQGRLLAHQQPSATTPEPNCVVRNKEGGTKLEHRNPADL